MFYINESNADRIIRIVLGIALLALGWSGIVGGTWGILLKYLGFVPLLTGMVGGVPLCTVRGKDGQELTGLRE